MVSISFVTVIGLALFLAIICVQAWLKANDSKKKAQDDIDKEIDAATNAGDILNVSGELRDKK